MPWGIVFVEHILEYKWVEGTVHFAQLLFLHAYSALGKGSRSVFPKHCWNVERLTYTVESITELMTLKNITVLSCLVKRLQEFLIINNNYKNKKYN